MCATVVMRAFVSLLLSWLLNRKGMVKRSPIGNKVANLLRIAPFSKSFYFWVRKQILPEEWHIHPFFFSNNGRCFLASNVFEDTFSPTI